MGSREENQQKTEEVKGNGVLVSIETENVDASGADDDSTGLGDDDFLGRTNKEGEEKE